MQYVIGTNFDPALVQEIARIDTDKRVKAFYGAIDSAPSGGGISHGFQKDRKTLADIADHVDLIKQHGYEFSYVFNSTCFGNEEFEDSFWKELEEFLCFLRSVHVDSLTIASPFLIEKIRAVFGKDFRIKASITLLTDSVRKVHYLAGLGIDGLVLDDQVNRDFTALRLITKTFPGLEVELIANQNCVHGCPYRHFHKAFLSHYRTGPHRQIDYHYLLCSIATVSHPGHILMSRWIRPEDQGYYEAAGITTLKIGMRSYPTKAILNAAKAYINRRYSGNLLDLLYGNYAHSLQVPGSILGSPGYSGLFSPAQATETHGPNTCYYTRFNLPAYFIRVDNEHLNGFLDFFLQSDCRNRSCDTCTHCLSFAKKAVTITDETMRNDYLQLLQAIRKTVLAK